jgi:hypothetical protein
VARVARPKSGGSTKNERVGGNGEYRHIDCDGALVESFTWERGQILDDGVKIVQAGCGEGGTGTGGS